jgi:MFS family permease
MNAKWHVLVGCFVAYLFEGMDIVMLAVALPMIIDELQISKSDAGLLFTATLLGVGAAGLVMGWFTDTYGRRKGLLVTLISFSVLTVGIAFATSLTQIMVMRFLAGLGLGGIYGVVSSYVSETWPPAQRSRAVAFVLSSFSVGAGFASAAGALLIPQFGWRSLFLLGVLGLLWAFYIYFYCPESEIWKDTHVAQKTGEQKTKHSAGSFGEIFSGDLFWKTVLGTLASLFALTAYWGVTTWLPAFLVTERGLSVGMMGIFFAVLNVGMFIGYNVFGYLSDVYGKKLIILVSFAGAVLTLPIYVWAENHTLLFCLGLLYGFFIAFSGLFGAYFAEFYPARIRTTGTGFCFNVSRGLSAFAPFLLGFLATSYSLAFAIGLCAVFYVLAAVCIALIPSEKREIEGSASRGSGPRGAPWLAMKLWR